VSVSFAAPSPDDVAALAALHVACWRETYAGILPTEILDGLSTAEKANMWNAVITDHRLFKAVVRKDGELGGFVICGPARDGAGLGADGEILAVYLLKFLQGQGIGTELLARSAEFWLGRGGKRLVVLSLPANSRAAGFYESLGGRKVRSGGIDASDALTHDDAYLFEDLGELVLRWRKSAFGA